jgi:CheY-like chemotaxis protein
VIQGCRVLLVEDEAIIAMTTEDMLEELGCTVAATAASLEAAFAAARSEDYDIALLDINLNGERSLPLAAELRSAGRPFLFTTGYGPEGAGTMFADVPVVTKPYWAADLAKAIERALAGR